VGLLLDTHVLLWWLSADKRLPDELRQRLNDDPDVWVSAVTVWEIATKQSIGKLDAPRPLSEAVTTSRFQELPITFDHAVAVGNLPVLHRDPFDRMLVAQARHEQLTLVTADPQIHRYEVDLLKV
jgi:PIN domain nuclease of toxin-antitoxin system